MIFELGKSYIVDVTEKGIIPLMEFDESKWYNKDSDDLDFLTDAKKDVIINSVLNKIRAEIEREITYKPMEMRDYRMGLTNALKIIDKHKAEREDRK